MAGSQRMHVLLCVVLAICTACLAQGQPSFTSISLPAGAELEGIAAGPPGDLFVPTLKGRIYHVRIATKTATLIYNNPSYTFVGAKFRFVGKSLFLYVAGGLSGGIFVFQLTVQGNTYRAAPPRVLRVPGSSFVNDIAFGGSFVYATDSQVPTVYQFNQTALVARLPLGADFQAVGFQFRGNGIAVTSNGAALIVANSLLRNLYYYDLAKRTAIPLRLTGDIRPDGILLTDGDKNVWVANNALNEITRVSVDLKERRGYVTCSVGVPNGAPLLNPATITFTGGRVWAANAKFSICRPSPCPTVPFEVVGFRPELFCPP